ncbi:hypothetical protein Back2_27380 [Nocardioides baekrokdamisoli]|uniref:HTH tetR-type domain-containing protein n=2 Tax=Nocardioides baekrokdamisoli TaxID=1804624 RepID=A0A3G9IXM9_9ACTN|nr:hypothetical protein Back2_27380 [Nocardioides baekrokdamisoli]
MIAAGEPVSVQSLAERAGVSRATAYRYFTNADSIVLNASLPAADNPFRDPQWEPPGSGEYADLPIRMGQVVVATSEWAFDHANELRSVLAASLSPDSATRGMSRVGKLNRGRWIDSVLADLPPDIDPETRQRLTNALMPLFGADAVVWTTDAAELDRDQAIDQLRWTAETLVRAVLAQS